MRMMLATFLLATCANSEITTNKAEFYADYPVIAHIPLSLSVPVQWESGVAVLSDALTVYTIGPLELLPGIGIRPTLCNPLSIGAFGSPNVSFNFATFAANGEPTNAPVIIDHYPSLEVVTNSNWVGVSGDDDWTVFSANGARVAISSMAIHGEKILRIIGQTIEGNTMTLRGNMPFRQVEYAETPSGPWGAIWLSLGEESATVDIPASGFFRLVK